MSKSRFVPNSFQTPNAYVDRYARFLTGDEFKVLMIIARRRLGSETARWQRVSVPELARLSGIGSSTVTKCAAALVRFGFLIVAEEADPKTSRPRLYDMQMDSALVDEAALTERVGAKRQANQARMTAARAANPVVQQATPPPVPQTQPSPCATDPALPLCHRAQEKKTQNPKEKSANASRGASPPLASNPLEAMFEATVAQNAEPWRGIWPEHGLQVNVQRVIYAMLTGTGLDPSSVIAGCDKFARQRWIAAAMNALTLLGKPRAPSEAELAVIRGAVEKHIRDGMTWKDGASFVSALVTAISARPKPSPKRETTIADNGVVLERI